MALPKACARRYPRLGEPHIAMFRQSCEFGLDDVLSAVLHISESQACHRGRTASRIVLLFRVRVAASKAGGSASSVPRLRP